jgi:hypothetical protein
LRPSSRTPATHWNPDQAEAPTAGNDDAPVESLAAQELDKLRAVSARTKGKIPLKKILTLLTLAVGFAAPASAQPMTGMAALQYYVGTWSCMAGPIGSPPSTATASYTIDSGVMREWVVVPVQGKMTSPYVLSIATTYDAKNGRYVETFLDNTAGWSVSFAQPWTGNTEQWTDQSTYNGKLGRSQTIRTDQNSFTFTGYPSVSSTQPDFQGTCNRSS